MNHLFYELNDDIASCFTGPSHRIPSLVALILIHVTIKILYCIMQASAWRNAIRRFIKSNETHGMVIGIVSFNVRILCTRNDILQRNATLVARKFVQWTRCGALFRSSYFYLFVTVINKFYIFSEKNNTFFIKKIFPL